MSYVSTLTASQGWENFTAVFGQLVDRFPFLWLLAGIGLISVATDKSQNSSHKYLIPLFVISSVLMVIPGYYFHHHYFVLLFPALVICVAAALARLNRLIGRDSPWSGTIVILFFLAIAGAGILSRKEFYFSYSNDDYSTVRYFGNPFREAITVADYVRSNTAEKDRILVLGSEAEIYFYARRAAASGYLFVHGMVSNQPRNLEMQDELIAEAEKNSPELMVLCGVRYSWLQQPGTPDRILKWFEEYAVTNYEITGFVDMVDRGTIYRWGKETEGYVPKADNYLVVYKKRKQTG